MKKYIILVVLTALASVIFISSQKVKTTVLPTPITDLRPESYVESDITASFEIFTYGTKRIFSDPKYHNLNSAVFLEASDPNTVNVKSEGITWDDFFKTLPMTLNKECIVTGTKQTFCSGNGKSLKFYINNIEDASALDKTIHQNDNFRVIFK